MSGNSSTLFGEKSVSFSGEKPTVCILFNESSFSAPHLILGATVRPLLPTAQPTSVETEGSVASEPMVSLKLRNHNLIFFALKKTQRFCKALEVEQPKT